MELQDKDLLKAQNKQAKSILANKVQSIPFPENFEASDEAEKAAASAHKNFLDNAKKDKERLKNAMLLDAESLLDYFLFCGLLVAWSDLSKTEADKKKKLSPERLLVGDYNLANNQVIDYFRKASKFKWQV